MKYIFDFDDVLFKNTEMLKPRIFRLLAENTGMEEDEIKRRYFIPENRDNFSLVEFIKTIFNECEIPEDGVETLFKEIMSECHNFLNKELVHELRKIRKEDLFIVTTGREDWNWSKLISSGVLDYFKTENIKIVPGDKTEAIREICEENKGQEIVFIDDKKRFIDGLENLKEHYPSFRTILYDRQGHLELMDELGGETVSELKRSAMR